MHLILMKAILKYAAILILIILVITIPLMLLDKGLGKTKENGTDGDIKGVTEGTLEEDISQLNNEYIPFHAKKGDTELRDTVLDLIYEYVFALNDGDYEKAYNLLAPEYREYRFKEIEQFMAFSQDRYKVDIGITVDNLQVIDKGVVIGNIEIFSDQIGDKPLSEDEMFTYKDVVAIANIGEKLYLSFDNFYKANLIDVGWKSNQLSLKIQKQYIFGDRNIYAVAIKNLSDDRLNIWDIINNVTVTDSKGKVVWISNRDKTIEYDLIPGEEKVFQWSFNSIMGNGEYIDISYNEDDIEKKIRVNLIKNNN